MTSLESLFVLCIGLAAVSGVLGFAWDGSQKDNAAVTVCKDAKLDLRLKYSLTNDETEVSRQWSFVKQSGPKYYTYANSDNVVYAAGGTKQLEAVNIIEKASFMDSGRFTLTVAIKTKSGGQKRYTRNVQVFVAEPPVVTGGNLRVTSKETSGAFILSCGPFTSRGSPEAAKVVWTLPNKKQQQSTRFEKGYFELHVKNEASSSGKYTCRVEKSATTQCAPKNSPVHQAPTYELKIEKTYSSCEKTPKKTGIYSVDIPGYGKVSTICNHDIYPGGWMVFQRRFDGSVSFARTWNEYVNGFGSPTGEFWLGLEPLHQFTAANPRSVLKLVLEKFSGQKVGAQLLNFSVGPASDNYRLGYWLFGCGKAPGEIVSDHSNSPFSTKDRDNDQLKDINCSTEKGGSGGWWYVSRRYCHVLNLNGHYFKRREDAKDQSGLVYYKVAYDSQTKDMSLKGSQMMVRSFTLNCDPFMS